MTRTSDVARTLAEWYPELHHMAEPGSWPSIKAYGLLSTSALLDLFEVTGSTRMALEQKHRPESVSISHARYGAAVVRDQKPMSDSALRKCLRDGLTPTEWYKTLNRFAYFWVSEARLTRLLGARAYRSKRQCVIVSDTAKLLARHSDRVRLSPINSGATVFNPQPRGRDTFLPIADYPLATWRKKRGQENAVVELAVDGGVPNIADFVLRVYETGGGKPDRRIA